MSRIVVLLNDSEKRTRTYWIIFLGIVNVMNWIGVCFPENGSDIETELAMAFAGSVTSIILYFCAYKGYGSKMLGWSMFGAISQMCKEFSSKNMDSLDFTDIIFSLAFTGLYLWLSGKLITINRQIREQVRDPLNNILKERLAKHLGDSPCKQILKERTEEAIQKWPDQEIYIKNIFEYKQASFA